MREYHLFSIRMGGWMTSGAAYTSDVGQAKKVDGEQALIMCKRQKGGMTELGLVPVPVDLVEEILK